jgi:hypothetical protein
VQPLTMGDLDLRERDVPEDLPPESKEVVCFSAVYVAATAALPKVMGGLA